jgi:hypothetical protein
LSVAGLGAAQQKCPAVEAGNLPLKYRGGPTVAAISPCDLMTRLYVYADDSMLGRRVGTPDNLRATAYIEREVRRMGLKPAGDSGGYFQYLPVFERRIDSASTITVAGQVFHYGPDFTAAAQAARALPETPAVFGGTALDTTNLLSPDAVRGKLLVLRAAPGGGFGRGRPASPALQAYQAMTAAALAVLTIPAPPGTGQAGGFAGRGGPTGAFEDPAQQRGGGGGGFGGGSLATIREPLVQAIFGAPADQLAKGAAGKAVAVDLKVTRSPLPTRNVVAVLEGSDPVLRNQYVAIGAHNDHLGYTMGAAGEHDSLKAYDIVALTLGGDTRPRPVPTEEMWARINQLKDSLRRVYPARPDSIANGADDDGSGSVSVLEIAEAFASAKLKPKRSIVFVWHTGEEAGLWGSQWFTNHPSVPRDSIVAQLNLDMVGRGAPTDIPGKNKEGAELHGAANYVQLVGSRRLSTELGDLAEQINQQQPVPLLFDYAMDADGHPQRIYCRSDHYNYARYGIPIVFFTTGGHADYHQNTDEPQYIQYRHMAMVDQLVFDLGLAVANLDHRVVVDKAKPANPFGSCVQ